MTITQIAVIMGRIDAIWPPKKPPADAERAEWARFLQNLDGHVCERAIEELKLTLGWRPSMADFKSAYNLAVSRPVDDLPGLPAAEGRGNSKYADLYGSRQDDWIYCWKCGMAITLTERCDRPLHHAGKGLHHARCPRSGESPTMPAHLRIEREDALRKRGATS